MADTSTITTTHDPFTRECWLIDNNQMEIDKIQQHLPVDVLHFSDFNELINKVSERFTSQDSTGTLIVTEHIPEKLNIFWDKLIQIINTFKQKEAHDRLVIFEISADAVKSETHVFQDSILCSNIDDFLDKTHNIRFQASQKALNVDDTTKALVNELEIENTRRRKKNEELKEKLEQNSKNTEEIQNKFNLLQQQINSYSMQKDNALKERDQAVKDKEAQEHQMQVLQKQTDKLTADNNQKDQKITDLEIKNKAKKDKLTEQFNIITSLKQELQDTKDELEQQSKQREALLNARDEMESNEILSEQINALQEKNKELNSQNINLRQQIENQKIDLQNKTDEINDIKQGYKNVNRIGYSNEFAKIEFNKTDLIYFKIIDPLPFHRYYIKKLMETIRQINHENMNKPSQLFKMIFYKVDFGNDTDIIGQYPLIKSLNSINDEQDFYRLMPGLHDNEGVTDFESKYNYKLIFIDYLDNNKYYADTKADKDLYALARKKETLQKLNLKGKYITYDEDSLLDLRFNSQIPTMTQQNQETNVIQKLSKLITTSTVIKKALNN